MMIRWFAIPVAFLLLAAAGVPAVSQEDEEKKDKLVPVPFPGSPENDKFYIFGSIDDLQEQGQKCGASITGMWTTSIRHDARLYGSNNPEDPCRVTGGDANDDAYSTSLTTSTGSVVWTINMYPKFANGTPLREGEPFNLHLVLVVKQINPSIQYSFGDARPAFTLRLDKEVLGSWDQDPPISVDTIQGPEEGAVYLLTYDVELGKAPATLDGGVMNLTVDISNFFGRVHTRCLDTNDPKAPDPNQCGKVDPPQDPRRIGTKIGLSLRPENQGWLQIPFADGADQFFPRYIPPKVVDPDFGMDENETEEDDNVTGNETEPAETSGPTNNTTTTQVEKGFLPGFEAAVLVTSAFLALVLIGRVRGRPPVNGRH